MDVRHMRQVLAIHRHGSFVRAAEELGIAQPTLSKSIARLEDQLGVKLFDRSGAGAQATPLGELILGRARRIVADAERLARDIELTARGDIGEARIGVGPAARSVILPELAARLARRYPELRLDISLDRRERLLADLHSGALDIVFTGRGPDMDGPDLLPTDLVEEAVVAVASPDHPLAQRAHITLEDFAAYPTAAGGLPSLLLKRNLEQAKGLAAVAPHVVCNDDFLMKRLTVLGVTTMCANLHLLQAEIESGELVRLPLDLGVTMSIAAVMTRPSAHSPILRDIVQLAWMVCRDLELPPPKEMAAPRAERAP